MKLLANLTVEYDFASDEVLARCRRADGTLLQASAVLPRTDMARAPRDFARDIVHGVIEKCARDVLREALKDV